MSQQSRRGPVASRLGALKVKVVNNVSFDARQKIKQKQQQQQTGPQPNKPPVKVRIGFNNLGDARQKIQQKTKFVDARVRIQNKKGAAGNNNNGGDVQAKDMRIKINNAKAKKGQNAPNNHSNGSGGNSRAGIGATQVTVTGQGRLLTRPGGGVQEVNGSLVKVITQTQTQPITTQGKLKSPEERMNRFQSKPITAPIRVKPTPITFGDDDEEVSSTPASALPGSGGMIRVRNEFYQPPQPAQPVVRTTIQQQPRYQQITQQQQPRYQQVITQQQPRYQQPSYQQIPQQQPSYQQPSYQQIPQQQPRYQQEEMQMQVPQETGMEYVPQILPEHFFTAPVAPAAAPPVYATPTETYRKTVRNTAHYQPQPTQVTPAYAAPKVAAAPSVLTTSPVQGFRVMITNLHPVVTEEDVVELFQVAGDLKKARLLRPGTAEVMYNTREEAQSAVRKYNKRELDGMPMSVQLVSQAALVRKVPVSQRLEASPSPPPPSPVPVRHRQPSPEPMQVERASPAAKKDEEPASEFQPLKLYKPPPRGTAQTASNITIDNVTIHKALFKTKETGPVKPVTFTVKI